MLPLVIVENQKRWRFELPGAQVVSARDYLAEGNFSELQQVRVFNLCRRYSYQSVGYYVSLLAEARGHRPLPSVATLQDLRLSPVVRVVSEVLDSQIQRALSRIRADTFTLSIYFGRNMARRYDPLSQALFSQLPAPFLRADLVRQGERWRLDQVRPIAAGEIPEQHLPFVQQQAERYFARPRARRLRRQARYELAILVDPEEREPPSNPGAIQRFVRAARRLGVAASLIQKDDYGRIAEYDALFIRQTTAVNHYTFRFARRAAAEGLVVIDDPQSIVRCSNKVYQHELFARHDIPCPRSLIADRTIKLDETEREIGLPCVVKQPDSAFSRGVLKADSAEELARHLESCFSTSELVVVQAFTPSEFDWRIGVLDGKPLYACRYHMAEGHWQIRATAPSGRPRYGRIETLPIERAPQQALKLAVRCAKLIGDGLYGVDIKQLGERFVVIEINDNPNLDTGYEDAVLGDALYRAVIELFVARIERRTTGNGRING